MDGIYFDVNDHIAQLNLLSGSYVVCGNNKALVVDTGYGTENHKKWVREYTDLPLILACTHSHPDHVRGNVFYNECLLNPADFDIYEMMFDYEHAPKEFQDLRPGPLKPIHDGDIIDLGGRHIEVIETPGHTPGSTCFLDIEGRVLITGDTILHDTVWLFFPYSLTVETYNRSLKKLNGMRDRFNTLLTGHTSGLQPLSLLDDLIEASDAILEGKTDRAGIFSFGENMGEGLPCCYFGDHNGTLVYRKDMIFDKKS